MSEINPVPKLSVITVTYNAEATIDKTLQSLFSQTFKDYELIVIDGRSTDATLDILESNRAQIGLLVSEPDRGIYDAMNKGLARARGEYVQFLNAGDYYFAENVLEDVFAELRDSPSLIYGNIIVVKTDGKCHVQKAGVFDLDSLLKSGTGVLCHQAMFVKTSVAPQYNTRYKYKGELNWYFDLLETANFRARQCDIEIVYYTLGGVGYKYFISNRLEWLLLILRRFGLRTTLDSGIVGFLFRNSLSRYPPLRKCVNRINRIRSVISRG